MCAGATKKRLTEVAPPRALPVLEMRAPCGGMPHRVEARVRKKVCAMNMAKLQKLVVEVGVSSGSWHEHVTGARASWSAKACMAQPQAPICGEARAGGGVQAGAPDQCVSVCVAAVLACR